MLVYLDLVLAQITIGVETWIEEGFNLLGCCSIRAEPMPFFALPLTPTTTQTFTLFFMDWLQSTHDIKTTKG